MRSRPLLTPSEVDLSLPRAHGAAGQRPVLTRDNPLNVFGNECHTRCLSPLPIAAKKPLTISMFSSMLIESLLSFIKRFRWNGTFRNHPSRPDHTVRNQLLQLLEQILKNQLPPGAAACVHEPSALDQLSQLDGCEPQFLTRSATGATASSSSLDRKTTRCPPSTSGSVASLAAPR